MAPRPYSFGSGDTMDRFDRAYDRVRGFQQQDTYRRAGNALRDGNYGGAASEFYGAGMLDQGLALEDRRAQGEVARAKAQKDQQAEAAKFALDAAARLRQLHDSGTNLTPEQRKQRVMAGFQQIAPRFRELGESDEEIEGLRRQIEADPDTTLTMLGAGAAKEAGFEIVKGSDGSYVAVDPKTGRPAYQFAPPRTVSVPEGGALYEIPGMGGAEAPAARAVGRPEPPAASDADTVVADLTRMGARVTSGVRSPADNARVGGVADSYHLASRGGVARDLVPPQGMPMGQFHAEVKRRLPPGWEAINEGDHVHIEPGPGGSAASGPGGAGPAPGGARLIVQRPKAAKPQQVRLTPEETVAAGYQEGSVVFRDPTTGEETVKQGPGAGSGKITDGQRHTAALTYRVVKANDRINSLASRGLYKPRTATDSLFTREKDGTIRLIARTDEDRQFLQAAKEWLLPILRKDTGAAVTDGELREYMETYIPKYEDSAQTRWQKAQARNDAMEALYGESSAAYEDQFGPKPKWKVLTESVTKAPPPEAIAALKRDPRLAQQFDAKYGAGSAKRYGGR